MIPVLPLPAQVTERPGGTRLVPGCAVVVAEAGLRPVADRLAARLGQALGAPVPVRTGSPAMGDVHLAVDPALADEGYRLVTGRVVELTGGSPAGLRHATTTLLALVGAPPAVPGDPRVVDLPGLDVLDQPRYPWRGLMLDVARHFHGVEVVEDLLDLMADLRLNRLHLHLSDDQGWRVEVATRPLLTERSGTSAVGGDPGGWFTAADLRRIVAHADRLGIVVVPEIDSPGHVNAAQHAYGELTPTGVPTPVHTGLEVGFSRLHADLPATAPFLRDVLGEVAGLVGSGWLHVGGDEPPQMPAEEYRALVDLALTAARAAGATPVGWQEAADALTAGDVVQYWDERTGRPQVSAAARRGVRVLLSPASRTYLDLKPEPGFPLGLEWAGLVPLERAYQWDPDDVLPDLPAGAVIGVEACLWTETVRTRADLTALLLPRLAAVAEVAWSPAGSRDLADFRERLAAVAPTWAQHGWGPAARG